MNKATLVAGAAILAGLAACGDTSGRAADTADNQLTVDRNGGEVTGTAGAAWTDEELRTNAFGVICAGDGESIASIDIQRAESGTATFAATCTS